MKNLEFDVMKRTRSRRDGSRATQANRHDFLRLAARQISEKFRRLDRAEQLKPKHIEYLIERWKDEEISPGTIKNRLSSIRWLLADAGKAGMLPVSNDALGIERRTYVATENRAIEAPTPEQLNSIQSDHVRASLLLQEAFGLRKEESIKFRPDVAIHDDYISLRASWCKGGRPRTIQIRTDAQRDALAYAREVAGSGSLIPAEDRYIDHLKRWERQVAEVGLSRTHGLRHAYAQHRYEELTGWPSPVRGGPSLKEMNVEQRAVDHSARQQVSRELGHERLQVTAVYLGR